MRVIIIEDKDARALLDALKLDSMTFQERHSADSADLVQEIHRIFHYRVCTWLQDQGCNVVRGN
jgi:hypothetical protein